MSFLSPDAEAKRLQTLWAYDILDSLPERALDDLTTLASQICETPIALISLVDKDRQWFKSRVGLESPETPREMSFCAHALNQNDRLLIVPDATKDERFAKNPLVTGDPSIRFYAGAPLVTPRDGALGTLCVIDRRPRTLTPLQQKALQVLARQVVTHVELQYNIRALQKSEESLTNAFDSAAIGMALVSTEGEWLKVNAALCDLVGYGPEELYGSTFQAITHPDDLEIDLDHVRDLLAGKTTGYHMEKRYFHKSGALVWVELSVSLVRNAEGRALYFSSQVQDITKRKEALAAQEELAKKAMAAERAKGDFLAVMSHEIRTPMNGVIGMASILADTELTDLQRECVETITTSGEALMVVINDILDFSKIESGKMSLESRPFNLQTCLEECIDLFAEEIRAKNLEAVYLIAPEVPLDLIGDAMRLRQIMINLIGNAIKFTAEGEVVINVETREARGQFYELSFSVADTGIGMSLKSQAKLFGAFQQLDSSTTRKFGGTGLGLAICKKLAELMGGDISVESELGRGSTFTFTAVIAAAEKSEKSGPAQSRTTGLLKVPSILVVDGNATSRRALTTQMTSWKMISVPVATGQEALGKLSGQVFDLVVLDEQLPDFDVATFARKIAEIRPVPVVLIASFRRQSEGDIFYSQLRKPLKLSQLFSVIARITGAKLPTPTSTEKVFDGEIATQNPLRILLAEDNVVNQKVVFKMLSRFGYGADLVVNGRAAVQAVQEKSYDLVLMDIQMPEMDGIEATRLIKEQQKGNSPTIIALTAEALEHDERRFLDSGFDGYLSKPLQVGSLKAALVGTSAR